MPLCYGNSTSRFVQNCTTVECCSSFWCRFFLSHHGRDQDLGCHEWRSCWTEETLLLWSPNHEMALDVAPWPESPWVNLCLKTCAYFFVAFCDSRVWRINKVGGASESLTQVLADTDLASKRRRCAGGSTFTNMSGSCDGIKRNLGMALDSFTLSGKG